MKTIEAGRAFSQNSKQAGVTGVETVVVLAVLALLALLTAPLWSHGTSLQSSATKSKIDVGERTQVVVVAYEKPRWSVTSRPVVGGTVTLKFDNGVQILPGAQTGASSTTNSRGAASFIIVGGTAGNWTGTGKIKVGSGTWSDETAEPVEVTGTIFTGTYRDEFSLELDDD